MRNWAQITLRKVTRYYNQKADKDPTYCRFKKVFESKDWRFRGPEGKLRGLAWGESPNDRNRAVRRCPLCNKRLKLYASFCTGGEFVVWELPEHKPRITRGSGPKRQSKIAGRGK
jgi:hypothetical protein